MNFSLLLNALLATTVLLGFMARYLAVLTHRISVSEGRLGLVIFLAVILYTGIIFASFGKLAYGDVFKSFVILGLVYTALDTMLGKLAKRI